MSYNITSAHNKLGHVFKLYRDYDVLFLQGTRLRKKTQPFAGKQKMDTGTPDRAEWLSQCGRFWVISWGWSRGVGSNHMAGVIIALNVKTLPREAITHRIDPDPVFGGRFGMIRFRSADQQPLTLSTIYCLQESEESSLRTRFWSMVYKKHSCLPKREIEIWGGDFNGSPNTDESDPYFGAMYDMKVGEKNENGEALHTLARACKLDVPNTKECSLNGTFQGWRGETFFSDNGNSKIDHMLVSKGAHTTERRVDINKGFILSPGTKTKMSEHAPLTMTVHYDLSFRYKRRIPPQRWNIAKLRIAQDDQVFRQPFVDEVRKMANDDWETNETQGATASDPSPLWGEISKKLLVIAHKHFGAVPKPPVTIGLNPRLGQ